MQQEISDEKVDQQVIADPDLRKVVKWSREYKGFGVSVTADDQERQSGYQLP